MIAGIESLAFLVPNPRHNPRDSNPTTYDARALADFWRLVLASVSLGFAMYNNCRM